MTESVEAPERIWIESEGECPYFYHEDELSDVAPPITEYVRADKLRAEIDRLRAEVEVWKASFEQAAAGHATYAERTENIKLLPMPEGEASSFGNYEVHDNEAMIEYARANVLHYNATLQAEIEALLDALRQITEWPDGGNRYGQENIKRFAQAAIDAAIRKEDHNG